MMQEYVPFLETYFKYNAYPSAPDRVALAKKSMMTPRQIEVWVSYTLLIKKILVVNRLPSFKITVTGQRKKGKCCVD